MHALDQKPMSAGPLVEKENVRILISSEALARYWD
jgi:hypothetical protein